MCNNNSSSSVSNMESIDSISPLVIIPIISCVLHKLICENQRDRLYKLQYNKDMVDVSDITPFHSPIPSSYTIEQYLFRIANYTNCSGEVFILMLIYIDRMIQYNPGFVVNYFTIHRIMLAGSLLAAKFHDEDYHKNSYYAFIGEVELAELNILESLFLYYIRFDLYFEFTNTFTLYFEELFAHSNSCGCLTNSYELCKMVEMSAPFATPFLNSHSDISSISSGFDDMADSHMEVERFYYPTGALLM